jgi:hypothetical protein
MKSNINHALRACQWLVVKLGVLGQLLGWLLHVCAPWDCPVVGMVL